jgi:hypothetical protein
MNIRRYLTCLLAVLITVQSVIVMADTHSLHQIGEEHIKFAHSPQSDADLTLTTELSDVSDHDIADCNHCCHCHGQNLVIPTNLSLKLSEFFPQKERPKGSINISPGVSPDLFRPPIS